MAQCHGAIKSYADAIHVYHQGKLLKCCWNLGAPKFSKGLQPIETQRGGTVDLMSEETKELYHVCHIMACILCKVLVAFVGTNYVLFYSSFCLYAPCVVRG